MSEEKVNLEQLRLQRDDLVAQNQGLEQAIGEACRSILELVVPTTLLTMEKIHQLATGVCKAQEEATKVHLELNLKITKLQLKVQPSTPLEFIEKCHHTIHLGLEAIEDAIQDCTGLLDQLLFTLNSLQEDPTLQRLEIEVQEL